MNLPNATYRLQLRGGVDFDSAISFLPHLRSLGLTHLYLSPIFCATEGSTHGYDITDPGRVDPVLGGQAGFDRLAKAAQTADIGLILDLVPNHTAFSLENAWLVDVLRHGPNSRFAGHFDIDWDEGALVLPWLDNTFEALVDQGAVRREGDHLHVNGMALPLRDGVETDSLLTLHESQFWRLSHWSRERDGVTHRRFFNVTGLIGMRVEVPEVFDDMHALPLKLLRDGQVQGFRLDHIDGLADPASYLSRLRQEAGDTPIWVEKILTGAETLPDWPVEGTTGYEAATMIARSLGDGAGAARLYDAWTHDTGGSERFHDALTIAKGDVIRRDLASELRRLINLVQQAVDPITGIDPGEEELREVFIALLLAFPRYRSYFVGAEGSAIDRALMEEVCETAANGLRSREMLDLVHRMIAAPSTSQEQAVQRRFQQITGALLAKSHEDTAGFRFTPYLPACEVGADPDAPTCDAATFDRWAKGQPGTGLLLTSSHDTKRSEDARMRLVAMSHFPDDALGLISDAGALPEGAGVPGNVRWYGVQCAMALWDEAGGDLNARLGDHMRKALREADEITSWTHPDAETEDRVLSFVDAVLTAWRADPPAALARLADRGRVLSLAQVALKMVLPGIPDIYRGCEGPHFALTDPDNRHPVDLLSLEKLTEADGFAGQKARLTRQLLQLRAAHPDLMRTGDVAITAPGLGQLQVKRSLSGETLVLNVSIQGEPLGQFGTGQGSTTDLPPFITISTAGANPPRSAPQHDAARG